MPYSVIVVEDEELVRKEIEERTPWERLGLLLIGSASDGVEGEHMIGETNPDIVITDIRLPGQDGLTMLSHCPDTHALILSGHSDFLYMRKAIQLGVYDYLLKPIDDNDFEKSLLLLVDKLATEEREIEYISRQRLDNNTISLPTRYANHVINGAINFISKNFHHPIGLQETACELAVSESHLSRLFKEVTGMNFLQYLNAWRVNHSIILLGKPQMNITMISSACGFPTAGYFTKVFKKYLGMTPSQYREDHNPRILGN